MNSTITNVTNSSMNLLVPTTTPRSTSTFLTSNQKVYKIISGGKTYKLHVQFTFNHNFKNGGRSKLNNSRSQNGNIHFNLKHVDNYKLKYSVYQKTESNHYKKIKLGVLSGHLNKILTKSFTEKVDQHKFPIKVGKTKVNLIIKQLSKHPSTIRI